MYNMEKCGCFISPMYLSIGQTGDSNYYFKLWYNESYTQPLTRLLCFRTDTQEPYMHFALFTVGT